MRFVCKEVGAISLGSSIIIPQAAARWFFMLASGSEKQYFLLSTNQHIPQNPAQPRTPFPDSRSQTLELIYAFS
jgi:hypothetical protein